MSAEVIHGDMRDVLGKMIAEGKTVQSIVTDPPYHLTPQGKGGRSNLEQPSDKDLTKVNAGSFRRLAGGFMGKQWDGGNIAFLPGTWRLCWELLPPGGHLLAFAGTRTYHRMAVAIEEAGFEIRDTIGWLYGSGFPKSKNVSKAIDSEAGVEREVIGKSARHVSGKPEQRTVGLSGTSTFAETIGMGAFITAPATDAARQWNGWGTALKPAMELICVARKPLDGTVAANVLKHGTGALNIAATRISAGDPDPSLALRLYGLDDEQCRRLEPHACNNDDRVPERIDAHAPHILSKLLSWAGYAPALDHLLANGEGCDDCSLLAANFPADCPACCGSRDELLRHAEAVGLSAFPSQRGARGDSGHLRKEWSRIHGCLCNVHRANWDAFLGLMSYSKYIQRARKTQGGSTKRHNNGGTGNPENWRTGNRAAFESGSDVGRWPANVCHDGSDEVVRAFPESLGAQGVVNGNEASNPTSNVYGAYNRQPAKVPRGDSGSAARFFYSSKADAGDRLGSKHPTIKPVDLMRWLVRLITPPGGTVLDPFAGSGATGMACMAEGIDCILVEREAEYVADIKARIAHVHGDDTPLFRTPPP